MSIDLKAALDAAAVLTPDGKLRGHNVITADGNLILVRPGTLGLGASVEKGTFVTGLKDGWKLASATDIAAVKARTAKLDAEKAKAEKAS